MMITRARRSILSTHHIILYIHAVDIIEKIKFAFRELTYSSGWMHSDDLGYYDDNGEIVFMDRVVEVMHFRENEVSPIEIEQALLAHPGVLEVCVVPVPHSIDNHHPMAFVKKVPGSKVCRYYTI